MDEQVLSAFVGGDEAIALLLVEPLNGASCHARPPRYSFLECRGAARCDRSTTASSHYLPTRASHQGNTRDGPCGPISIGAFAAAAPTFRAAATPTSRWIPTTARST